ncbi:MAG TPA: outer membrane lipoprotein carrier protein LolA [Pyrinomonadaceae bacterium]|jgi:outer membrane lipoprotein-sorting protein
MKRFATLGLALAILVAAVALSSPSRVEAQSAGLVSALINRMERNKRDLKSLRAGISMEKYDAHLRDSDKRGGQVLYVPGQGRNAYVRIDWQYPAKETLAVADGQYTLFRPRLGMAYKGSAASSRAKAGGIFDFLNMSGQQIRTRFEPLQDIYEENLWGGVHTTHIKLVPKGGASYKYAEVWIDGSGMPVQTKVVERNDDATTVRLTNVERNAGISLDQFKLQLDGSVKIVKG